MDKLRFHKQYAPAETQDILARLIRRHIDPDKLRRYTLLWNSFRQRPSRRLTLEELVSLPFPPKKAVFFYDERQRILCTTRMASLMCFLQSLEPWQETDACIFDQDMDWVIAVTHEDVILCWGKYPALLSHPSK